MGGIIYLLLQVAFVGSMPPQFLEHGWEHVHVHFKGIFGPYAGLAAALGASVATYLIYAAAIISPAGTGLTYTATSSRLPFALAREGYLPAVFARLNGRKVPVVGLLVSYLAGVVVVITFRNWDQLLRFVTSAMVLVYALAPLSLAVLRRTAPGHRRPYRLPYAGLISRTAFCVSNLIIIWNGWNNDRFLFATVVGGVALYTALAVAHPDFRHHRLEWLASLWLVPYVVGMVIVSLLGPYYGGQDILHSWTTIVAVVVLSLGVYELAARLGAWTHHRQPKGEQPLDRWHTTVTLLEVAEH